MTPIAHFTSGEHVYRDEPEGDRLPNVTTILREAGGYDHLAYVNEAVLESARHIGQEVHEQIEMHHTLGEPLRHPDESVQPYLDAYGDFLEMTGYEPQEIEVPFYCACHRFAGTPDSFGWMREQRGIVEIKTTSRLDVETGELQVGGGYRHLVERHTGKDHRAWLLHLKDDGRYSLVPADGQLAVPKFMQKLEGFTDG